MAKIALFLKFYDEYKNKIFNYFFYRTGYNTDLSNDLVSEVFEKAVRSFNDFNIEKDFKSWIYRIAHNHLVDYYRKNNLENVSIDEIYEKEDESIDIEEEIDKNISNIKIREVIQKLKDSEKELITLRFINELSYDEISKILDKNSGAIRVAVNRILKKIKTILENE